MLYFDSESKASHLLSHYAHWTLVFTQIFLLLLEFNNFRKTFIYFFCFYFGYILEQSFLMGHFATTFTHTLEWVLGGWQGRGVTPDRLMTLWIHSCMVTQCDSPDMAGNGRQLRLTEPHLRLQAASKHWQQQGRTFAHVERAWDGADLTTRLEKSVHDWVCVAAFRKRVWGAAREATGCGGLGSGRQRDRGSLQPQEVYALWWWHRWWHKDLLFVFKYDISGLKVWQMNTAVHVMWEWRTSK